MGLVRKIRPTVVTEAVDGSSSELTFSRLLCEKFTSLGREPRIPLTKSSMRLSP